MKPPTGQSSRSALAPALAGMAALAMGMGIGRFAYTPLLPAMQAEQGLSIEVSGYLASTNFAGYLLGALLAMWIKRANRRRGFLLGLLLSALTTAAMALPSPVWGLAATRLLAGVASALILIHGSAIVLDRLAAAARPTLFFMLQAGVGVGIVISAGVVELSRRLDASVSMQWLALGVIATALGLAAAALRDLQLPTVAASTHPGTTAPPHPAVKWMVAAYSLLGVGYVITMTFIVVMVRGNADWRPWEMAVWLTVGLFGIPSNYLWLRAAERFGPLRALCAAYLLEAVGVSCAASADSLSLVFVGAALLGGTFMGITAMGLSAVRKLAPNPESPVIALMTVGFSLGQILGPAIGGRIAEHAGNFLGASTIATTVLLVAAAMVGLASLRSNPGSGR